MPLPLNPWVLETLRAVPTGGGYRFDPLPRGSDLLQNPRDPHYDGVLRPLAIGPTTVARSADDGASYCCGITLQVWLDAFRASARAEPAVEDPERFVADWFCPTMGHPGVAHALVERGLGEAVDPGSAVAGDFVQYWRSVDLERPSGHSAVFLGWSQRGEARTMAYWSSQPATGGVGHHSEEVGAQWQLHFVRAWRG